MRHVPLPQERPRRSVLAPSAKLVFDWEPFPKLVNENELKKLWLMHWREIALDQDTVPLDPDWDCYYALQEIGVLAICTARFNGHLAGYVFNHVGPHNHYCSTKFAHSEMFFLHPRFRKGWQPVKMFLENIRGLQARECKIHTVNFKLTYKDGRVGKLFQRLGYTPTDIVMRKVL